MLIPPHNKDAEESLLSCCINGGEEFIFEKVNKSIVTEDFYCEEHQQIWDSLCELSESNKAIDIVTVTEVAKCKNDDLIDIIIHLPSRSNMIVSEYVDIIKNKAKLRVLRREYMMALEKIEKGSAPDDIMNDVNVELDKFKPLVKNTSHIENSLDIIKDEFEKMASGNYQYDYIKTHISHLDSKIKLELGCVFTIAAPTSVGKSALSTNIALSSAKKDLYNSLRNRLQRGS